MSKKKSPAPRSNRVYPKTSYFGATGLRIKELNPAKYQNILDAIKNGTPTNIIAAVCQTNHAAVLKIRMDLVRSGEIPAKTIDGYIDRNLHALALYAQERLSSKKIDSFKDGAIGLGVILDKIASRSGRPTSIVEHRSIKASGEAAKEFLEAIEIEASVDSESTGGQLQIPENTEENE
jgi:hypothetical protein